MRKLLFMDPALRDGLNLTVRNGTKWSDATPGEVLEICDTEAPDAKIAQGVVVAAFEVDHNDPNALRLVESLLPFEHAEECRTYTGLARAMSRAYPDGWGPRLTLLFFAV